MSVPVHPIALGEERIPDGEEAAIAAVLAANLALLDTRVRPVRRGQHAKHHGCVDAELTVSPDVAAELRHGLFAAPGVYPAIVRFSNGGKWDDRRGDAHGMAIKVLGVGGSANAQDFVLVDHPVFFLRDAASYAAFSEAFHAAKRLASRRWLASVPRAPDLAALLVLYARFFRSHRREFRLLREFAGKRPSSPLAIRYWSATPYRLGPHAVRLSARPHGDDAAADPAPSSPDRLREAMRAHLDAREARFDLLVQRQTDAAAMPVEDPTVAWDEAASPYREVASLRIPPQTFDDDEHMARCERLSFQPWHALAEHRPLGGINRVRRAVYEAMYRRRRELNEAATGAGHR